MTQQNDGFHDSRQHRGIICISISLLRCSPQQRIVSSVRTSHGCNQSFLVLSERYLIKCSHKWPCSLKYSFLWWIEKIILILELVAIMYDYCKKVINNFHLMLNLLSDSILKLFRKNGLYCYVLRSMHFKLTANN